MLRISGVEKPELLLRLANWALRRRLGRPVQAMAILGHHPRILAALLSYGAFLQSSKQLPAKLKRLAHLRVAMRVGCPS